MHMNIEFANTSGSGPFFGGAFAKSSDTPRALAGRSIMLVEDEALVAMDVENALIDAKANVIGPISDIDASVAIARDAHIDAAILDINLNGRDVFPAADLLQARGVPFIFQTGHGQEQDLQDRYPDVPVCQKPMDIQLLLRVLSALLEDRHGRHN